MKFRLRQYQKLTKESLPELSIRISKLGKRQINDKTLWNWVNNRYGFVVIVECDDKDLMRIKRIYKEELILEVK